MLTLISYDIADDKRRVRVMKLLNGYGRRVQRSVFECRLSGQELAALTGELLAIVDGGTDSVRCYPLDADTARRVVILGIGEVTAEPVCYLV